jgi:hypothetical protein
MALARVRRPPQDQIISLALPRVDTAAVDAIVVSVPDDSMVVIRTGPGSWTTRGRSADTGTVGALLRALADSSSSTELAARSSASHSRLGVRDDSSLAVRLTVQGKTVLDVLVGVRTPDNAGIYVRQSGDSVTYALRGILVGALARPLDDWRDRWIAAPHPDSIEAIEIRHGSRQYAIRKREGHWILPDGSAPDNARMLDLLRSYRPLAAMAFATDAEAAAFPRVAPGQVRFRGASGGVLAEVSFQRTDDALWVRDDVRGGVFRLNPWEWERLVPEERSLAARKGS